MLENYFEKIKQKPEEKERSGFVSPEKKLVTDRRYSQYLSNFGLPKSELKSKKILDVGSGLSEFFQKANEKFKEAGTVVVGLDPNYSMLGENLAEFKENLKKARLSVESMHDERGRLRDQERSYGIVKSAPNKIAGSHQELPFKEGSFDLVLANNSVLQFKDREISRRALQEIAKIIKESGEIRLQPVDLLWDNKKEELYMHTFEAPTEKTREHAKELGLLIDCDKKMFDIFRELEETGFNFFSAINSFGNRGLGRFVPPTPPTRFLIMRRDEKIPQAEGLNELKRISFKESKDGFHVVSTEVNKQQGR